MKKTRAGFEFYGASVPSAKRQALADYSMGRELSRLRSDFAQKMAELRVWRDDEERRIRAGHKRKRDDPATDPVDLTAPVPVSINQHEVAGGQSACSTIALCAAFSFLQLEGRTVTDIDWASVVRSGAKFWKHWKAAVGDARGRFLPVDEAYRFPPASKVRRTIRIHREIGGHLSDETVTRFCLPHRADDPTPPSTETSFSLARTVDALLGNARAAATFTCRRETIALMVSDGTCWTFDSHGLAGGGSEVREHRGRDELCAALRRSFPLLPEPQEAERIDDDDDNLESNPNVFSALVFLKRSEDP